MSNEDDVDALLTDVPYEDDVDGRRVLLTDVPDEDDVDVLLTDVPYEDDVDVLLVRGDGLHCLRLLLYPSLSSS